MITQLLNIETEIPTIRTTVVSQVPLHWSLIKLSFIVIYFLVNFARARPRPPQKK